MIKFINEIDKIHQRVAFLDCTPHPNKIIIRTWLSNMVKTNFKCMYLVDDILYRKITNSETNLKTSVNPSTPLLNTALKQNYNVKDHDLPQSTTSVLDPDKPFPERDHRVGNITQSFPPAPLPTDTDMVQSNNDSTNQEPLSEAGKQDMSIDKSDISPKENNDDNCACFNPIKPGREQKRRILKAPPRKRPTTQTESRDIVDHKPKRARLSPPKTRITKEDEYDWDNDPEIPELRERFRKIKYDINYPLPKKPALRKEKAPPPKSKIKEPDHRRGVKRKSSQEKPLHKKKRTDGRQKRKSKFPDSREGAKHWKSEIECKLCHTFLKTEKALERHDKNVHDSRKGDGLALKRKRSNTSLSGSYVKRQKPQPRAPILYQSYF